MCCVYVRVRARTESASCLWVGSRSAPGSAPGIGEVEGGMEEGIEKIGKRKLLEDSLLHYAETTISI